MAAVTVQKEMAVVVVAAAAVDADESGDGGGTPWMDEALGVVVG
jgi:hypothetical protein